VEKATERSNANERGTLVADQNGPASNHLCNGAKSNVQTVVDTGAMARFSVPAIGHQGAWTCEKRREFKLRKLLLWSRMHTDNAGLRSILIHAPVLLLERTFETFFVHHMLGFCECPG
jgi:hypothetical protein